MNPQTQPADDSNLSVGHKKVVITPEDLIFNTNTDENSYPIYLTDEKEVWIKTRPHRLVEEKDEYGWTRDKKVYDIPIIATFFVKSIEETKSENVTHELFTTAVNAVKEITNREPYVIAKLEVKYEVYAGDMERLVGEANAYVIKIISWSTPYSGVKCSSKKAWAIGYDWKKRMFAKYPQLQKYIYLKGDAGKHDRAYVHLTIKFPIVTEEFKTLFNSMISSTTTTTKTSTIHNLNKQVEELIKLIQQKESELETLKQQLQSLQLKLKLEELKTQVI